MTAGAGSVAVVLANFVSLLVASSALGVSVFIGAAASVGASDFAGASAFATTSAVEELSGVFGSSAAGAAGARSGDFGPGRSSTFRTSVPR